MTAEQERALAFVVSHNGIRVYSPTRASLDRYGPLADAGWVTIRDVGGEQETALAVVPTEAGRDALRNYQPH